jgi:hypothetical protein
MRWFFIILFLSYITEAQIKTEPVSGSAGDTLVHSSISSVIQSSPIREIFRNIELGLQNNDISKFKRDLGEIIFMTMSSGEHGYYSTNQATAVLVGFFSERRLVSFNFSRMDDKGFAPYATGRFVYIQKGIQKSAQVYVSLTQQDSLWVINQFNIY